MIVLIEYDRSRGQLVSKTVFDSDQRPAAQRARLELELRLHRAGIEREVVLLEAEDEASLLQTHERYFKTLEELVAESRAAVER
jgi:hypothetical protein